MSDREIQDTEADKGAVRSLYGRFLNLPPLAVDLSAEQLDAIWFQLASGFNTLSESTLDEHIAAYAGEARSAVEMRAHQLLMNVWHFRAEGEHFARHS